MSHYTPSVNYIKDIAQPGIRAPEAQLPILRQKVASLLRRSQLSFPGAQPVSFARKHLDELRKQHYYVCEKSDGIRYLLYLTETVFEPGTDPVETPFLIDRKNNFWLIGTKELHFPQKDRPVSSYHTETLIDGELVMDEFPEGKEPRLLVFDCLVLDGQPLIKRTLDKRLAYFKEMVLGPHKGLLDKYPDEKGFQPFTMHMKSMQFAYGLEMMFSQILPSLRHGNDGLIFTCTGSPYQFGTDQHILKWKPAEENTIDFRWKLEFSIYQPDEEDCADGITEPYTDYYSPPTPHLYVVKSSGGNAQGANPFKHPRRRGSSYVKFGTMHLEEDEWEQLKKLGDPLDERIVEAYQDEQKRWRFMRFRDDKAESNHISTAQSVIDSIGDSVSKQELLEAAPTIKERWKARDRHRYQQPQQPQQSQPQQPQQPQQLQQPQQPQQLQQQPQQSRQPQPQVQQGRK